MSYSDDERRFLETVEKSLDPAARSEFNAWSRDYLLYAMRKVGMREYAPLVGQPDGMTAAGRCICSACGFTYAEHPLDWRVIGYLNTPFLNVLCDGVRVKL